MEIKRKHTSTSKKFVADIKKYYHKETTMKYRKKPIEVEAFEWTGETDQIGPEWIATAIKNGTVYFEKDAATDHVCAMIIETLEGDHRANLGDFIICGVKGELYPCKPDIFTMTYQKVNESASENRKIYCRDCDWSMPTENYRNDDRSVECLFHQTREDTAYKPFYKYQWCITINKDNDCKDFKPRRTFWQKLKDMFVKIKTSIDKNECNYFF